MSTQSALVNLIVLELGALSEPSIMLTMNNLKDEKDETRERSVLLCTSYVLDDELGLLFMELRLRIGHRIIQNPVTAA